MSPHAPQKLESKVEKSAIKAADSTSSNQSFIGETPVDNNNSGPLAITVDPGGGVWFAETNPPAIVRFYQTTQLSFETFPVPTRNDCGLIWFLILDDSGNLWFSCSNEPLLWSFSTATHHFSNFTTGNPRIDPYSLALDPHTNQIWFTSIYTDQIGAFQITSGTATLLHIVNVSGPLNPSSTSGGPRFGPSGLAFDTKGNLFVTETFAAVIAEYDQSTNKFVNIWKLPQYAQPVGVVADQTNGKIWFTNHGSSLFGFVDENSGKVNQFATSLSSSGGAYEETLPYWIQASTDGSVWFDEHVGNKVARFDPLTDQLTEFPIPTMQSAPLRFALDDQKKVVWFTEFQGNKLGKLYENRTCNCAVGISPNEIALSGSSGNFTFNFKVLSSNAVLSSNFQPSISGSLSRTGDLASNVTLSFRALNSTAFVASLTLDRNVSVGNYSLTICPSQNGKGSTNPSITNCGILLLNILSGPRSTASLTNLEYAAIGASVLVVVGLVSFVYVLRWRKPS